MPTAPDKLGDKLDLLVKEFARIIDSEVALLCQLGGKGAATVISSWGLRTRPEEISRPREGGRDDPPWV